MVASAITGKKSQFPGYGILRFLPWNCRFPAPEFTLGSWDTSQGWEMAISQGPCESYKSALCLSISKSALCLSISQALCFSIPSHEIVRFPPWNYCIFGPGIRKSTLCFPPWNYCISGPRIRKSALCLSISQAPESPGAGNGVIPAYFLPYVLHSIF